MREDLLLERLQLGGGLEAELRHERLTGIGVRLEGLGLAAGSVQREHQQCPEALTERMCTHERRQLTHELRVASAGEICVDPGLEHREALVLELARGRRRERLVREVGERRSTPELERGAQCPRGRIGRRGLELALALLRQALEALEIDLLGLDVERVPGRARDEQGVRLERLPEARHVLLQRRLGVGGRSVAPELVDEPIARERLSAVQDEQREDALLPRSAECEDALALEHLEWAENAEVERARQGANVPR